jgi:GNAT superfamily N-acetyltransferase
MVEYCIARKDHLPGILSLYRQLAPGEESLGIDQADAIWNRVEKQGIGYFIATDGDKIVSSLYLAVIPNLTRSGRSIGFIENVITDEEYRRQGLGKKLIEMAIAYAKENNCYKVLLQSAMKRKGAHTFYESCGFDGNSKRAFEIRF